MRVKRGSIQRTRHFLLLFLSATDLLQIYIAHNIDKLSIDKLSIDNYFYYANSEEGLCQEDLEDQ